MTKPTIHTPLTNVQAELLKVFSFDIPETQLKELKKIISLFLLENARDKADAIWDKKGYTEEKLQELLNNK